MKKSSFIKIELNSQERLALEKPSANMLSQIRGVKY